MSYIGKYVCGGGAYPPPVREGRRWGWGWGRGDSRPFAKAGTSGDRVDGLMGGDSAEECDVQVVYRTYDMLGSKVFS